MCSTTSLAPPGGCLSCRLNPVKLLDVLNLLGAPYIQRSPRYHTDVTTRCMTFDELVRKSTEFCWHHLVWLIYPLESKLYPTKQRYFNDALAILFEKRHRDPQVAEIFRRFVSSKLGGFHSREWIFVGRMGHDDAVVTVTHELVHFYTDERVFYANECEPLTELYAQCTFLMAQAFQGII